MAHGYQNFMGNKDFHPSSFTNLRKVWEAKEKLKEDQKRQEELRQQYIKEQEQRQSKELAGNVNPVGFMYDAPPAFAKPDKAKDQEEETKLKFDWQKEDKAPPREFYARSNEVIHDKPFGIEVRNVKCLKCGKWGHVNTDKECPLYGKAKPGTENREIEPILTNWDTIEDGFKFKQCARERRNNPGDPLQQFVVSDEEDEIADMLSQFSPRQRKKILKKLQKSEAKKLSENKESKHKKERKKKKKRRYSSSSDDEPHKKRKRRHHRSSDSYSDSEDDDRKSIKKMKRKKYNSDLSSDSDSGHRRHKNKSYKDKRKH